MSIVVLVIALVATGALAGGRFPWPRRIGKEVETFHLTAHKNTPPEVWPDEPGSPGEVDRDSFHRALGTLCGRMPPERLDTYTDTVLAEAARFEVDPFLLGALMYDQSRCWPLTPKRDVARGRYGLTRIPLQMHAPQIRKGEYRYFVRGGDGWEQRTLDVSAYPYNKWKAAKPASNLYFAAAFIRVFTEQRESLLEALPGAPHRHVISHWFWGDRVREAEPENRVLTARRRLLEYYRGASPARVVGAAEGNDLVSPLDGVPRLVIDYFGNPRGNKTGPGHRGIDLDGAAGESVRAIAAGKVTFAGVDLPGAQANRQLTVKESAEFERSEMGPGGIYVSIRHENGFGTIYMHLETMAVAYGAEVKAGDVIGTLGRSGTKTSGPHLHLEFRVGTERIDPAVPLAEAVANPFVK